MPTASPLSTDPLLETQVFWSRYQKEILIGLAVVFLGIIAFGAYRFYNHRRNAAAAALLANAKAAPDYQKIMADYPRTGASISAHLLFSVKQREEQQFAEANGTLQKFISTHPKHEFVATAKMAMAANLESLGKTDEALDMYRRIAADHARNYNAPLAMLAQVQLLKQKGQIEEARRVCETVLTQYRDSYASLEASRYLKGLKPAAAAPAAAVSSPAAVEPVSAPTP